MGSNPGVHSVCLQPALAKNSFTVLLTTRTEALNTAGPSIAHLETQYSWAQIRLAATSLGSRPTGMEAPATATSTAMSNPLALLIWHTASSPCTLDEEPTIKDVELSGIRIGESTTLAPSLAQVQGSG